MKRLFTLVLLLISFLFITQRVSASQIQAINAGGDTQGSFAADTDYSGGSTYSSSNSVDTSAVNNPAPQAVYQTARFGSSFTYTLPNLAPNTTYDLRLHFNELYWGTSLSGNSGGVGSRVFNVAVNGTQVLNNFDIAATAGGSNKAIVEQFPVTADSSGTITIAFTTVTDNAMVNGIELLSVDNLTPTPTPTATPTPTPTLITTAQIADGAITTPKLADGAVDGSKLLDNIISMAKIIDGAITTSKIADGAVTQDKIADGASEPSLVQSWHDEDDIPLNALGIQADNDIPTTITLTVPTGKAYSYIISYSALIRYNFPERNGSITNFFADWKAGILANGSELTFLNQVVDTGYREDWNLVGGNNLWLAPVNTSWNVRLTEGTYPITVDFYGYSDNTMNTAHVQYQRLYITRVL